MFAQSQSDSTQETLVTDFKLRPYLNLDFYSIGKSNLSANSSYLKAVTYQFKESNIGLVMPLYTKNFWADSNNTYKSNFSLLGTLSSQQSVSTFSFMDKIENVRTTIGLRGIYFNGKKDICLVNISPFLAEDKNSIKKTKWRTYADFVYSRYVNDKFSYRLGLSYTYRFGGGRILPVLGLRVGNYNKGYLMIQIPKNISYTRKISRKGSIAIYTRPYGGTYRFTMKNADPMIFNSDYQNQTVVMNRTEFLTGISYNTGIGNHVYFNLGLGATTRRSVNMQINNNITGRGGNGVFGGQGKIIDIVNSGFINVGLTIYFGKATYYGSFSPLSEVKVINNTYDAGDLNHTNDGATNDLNVVNPLDIKAQNVQKVLNSQYLDIQDFLED